MAPCLGRRPVRPPSAGARPPRRWWPAAALALVGACSGAAAPLGRSQVSADSGSAAAEGPAAPLPASAAVVGRTVNIASPAAPLGRRLSWPATQLSFHFNGSELNLQLLQAHAAASLTERAGWNNHFDVTVDGTPTYDALVLADGPASYRVAHDLVAGEHNVVLRKRSESALCGEVQLLAATLNPGGTWLTTPAGRARRIEVIGASNEAGYGVHGVDPCASSDDLSNALAAWPTFVADRFGADLNLSAISGQGVLAWSQPVVDANGSPIADQSLHFDPMPLVWGRANSEDPNVSWDPSLFVPQVVVMALGPNDYDRGLVQSDSQRAEFVAQYAQFVAQVASAYAQPAIYLLLNGLQDANRRLTFAPDLQAVATAAGALGAQTVRLVTLPIYTGTVLGCGGHPNLDLQNVMADAIGGQIATDLGW